MKLYNMKRPCYCGSRTAEYVLRVLRSNMSRFFALRAKQRQTLHGRVWSLPLIRTLATIQPFRFRSRLDIDRKPTYCIK